MSAELKGKTAIVTGGSKGIGKGIVERLEKEGCKVIIFDISGKGKNFVKCDVSDFDNVKVAVQETVNKFKKIDILVNNAGIYPFTNLKAMSEKEWDKVIDVNLKGIFNCCKNALPFMKKGKIVNVASVAGTRMGFQGLTHYCATKSGIEGFTRALALELAPEINVNVVAPGIIETPGTISGLGKKGVKEMAKNVPLKRAGKPKDIASAVKFLVSSDADYITGQTLVVDGGWTLQ